LLDQISCLSAPPVGKEVPLQKGFFLSDSQGGN
jgi:hypothetical protein